MFLRKARVESFRGIRSMEVELGETTVLIGENGSGKSSFFDALRIVLGHGEPPGMPRFQPSDFPDAGPAAAPLPPLRIQLEFQEREPGEWNGALRKQLKQALHEQAGLATVRLEVAAAPARRGAPLVSLRCLDAEGQPLARCPAADVLEIVRRLSPLLQNGEIAPDSAAPGVQPPWIDLAQSCIRELDSMTSGEFRRCQQVSGEILDQARRNMSQRGFSTLHQVRLPGSGAQSLAPLLFFGNFLRWQGPRAFDPDALPILALSEVEAHLHLSLLASLWQILESLPVQKILTTYSADALSLFRLTELRRLVRRKGDVAVHSLSYDDLTDDEFRRIAYHVRGRRGAALFARCWLLVEGETEAWLLPEMARAHGYDFVSESVCCVEFAQCGVPALARCANALGIEWHLLTDGDAAGDSYTAAARFHLNGRSERERITQLAERDVEHHLWGAGYDRVFLEAAGRGRDRRLEASNAIERAIERHSKPWIALQVVESMEQAGSPGVPPLLARCIETAVALARAQDRFVPDAA